MKTKYMLAVAKNDADYSTSIESARRSCLVIAHSAQVVKAALNIDADLEMVLDWFENDFIDELGGTAMHLVLQGRHAQVIAFLDRVARDMAMNALGAQRESSRASRGHVSAERHRIYPNSNERTTILPPGEAVAFG
ncbi:hypothetical protein [Dyella psychrodurans]|uniref:Uncharacterized protein n=1 Tax=Dyella psychrodurans TaxID=1927960 RepID=A0A370XCH0_9GAMM|nr:hypothetical protein [Dyella psychrodurans]RDS86098.1 hypothetical protein DWU99_02175 [Dyella psychrodurans]